VLELQPQNTNGVAALVAALESVLFSGFLSLSLSLSLVSWRSACGSFISFSDKVLS